MIIVEGPDGAGKTTLVNQLAKDLNLVKGKRSVEKREDLYKVTVPDAFHAIGEAVRGDGPVKVWDRLFFSELIYWQYTTGECQFNPGQQRFIRRILVGAGFPVILCIPPRKVVYENIEHSEKDQTHYAVEHREEIYSKYLSVFASELKEDGIAGGVLGRLILYDYTGEQDGNGMFANGYEDLKRMLEHYLEIRKERMY